MLSLLGSAFGFVTGLAPAVFKYFERKQDNAQELAMMDKQIESNKSVATSNLQATIVQSDAASVVGSQKAETRITLKASQWVINTVAMVRPVIAYSFFFLFAYLEVSLVMGWLEQDVFKTAWDEDTKAIFGAIIGHYFGYRTSKHLMGQA
jgi:hypothetical protein